MNQDVKVIAFYLPQYHEIEENNNWYSKGFTEWVNVKKAKPLFNGHYQPRIPSELGYYDLSSSEIRYLQADLARESGLTAFCYYHYWFGDNKQLLEMPLKEVIRNKEPDFPFCLCWANHSWYNKTWNPNIKRTNYELLIEQKYSGKNDIDNHFYAMLEAFSDGRYLRVKGRLLFVIFDLLSIPEFEYFKSRWNELASKNNLPGFYFVSVGGVENQVHSLLEKTDGVALSQLFVPFFGDYSNFARFKNRTRIELSRYFKKPFNVVAYEKAIKHFNSELFSIPNVYPTIIPNWDHSPRSGYIGTILKDSTPQLFKKHAIDIFNKIKDKKSEDKIVFLKSWNEWGECNYMEPDERFGKEYIYALREALND